MSKVRILWEYKVIMEFVDYGVVVLKDIVEGLESGKEVKSWVSC